MSGWRLCTSAMSQRQKSNGFVCGLSTRNTLTPWSIQNTTTSRSSCHSSRHSALPKSSGKMSSYFFGGFSAYCTLPSGRRANHSGCSRTYGWSGRALEREVERDLDPEALRLAAKAREVLERAELLVHALVAAVGGADRPRRAGIRSARLQRVVAAFAVAARRSDESAAGRRRRSPSRRRRTGGEPPSRACRAAPGPRPTSAERTRTSAPKRASGRSTTTSSGGS